MRVTLVAPPEGVAFGLRTANHELVDRTISTGQDLAFTFTLRAKRIEESDLPRFFGPLAHGSPAERFVRINIGTLADQADSCWTRAAKIPLSSITWKMIDEAGRDESGLEAKVSGRAKDGGPPAATVPLLNGGWRVARSRGQPA